MNYFFTKSQSRRMSLVLVLCLVATLFAGCQKTKPDDTTPSTEEAPPGLVDVVPTTEATVPTETTEPVNENMATVTAEQTNVRSSPSTGAKIIGFLDKGTEVEIIKTETYMGVEWALIREGWIVMGDVSMNSGANNPAPGNTPPAETKPAETQPTNTTNITGTVTANGLFIRSEPSKTGETKGSYSKGTTITILETKNGWGRTDKGWVSMEYVRTNGSTNTNTNNNANTNTNTNNNTTTTGGTTYYVTGSELNIRDSASINGNKVGTYTEGDKVIVTETSNGWGKTDKGWVSMQYLYKTGATTNNTTKGIVTVDGLNIRTGPGTNYDTTGSSYKTGDRVIIQEQIGNWGCTDKGWISMTYVYVDGTKGENSGTGVVSADDVNVRSGPGTQYDSVGKKYAGEAVQILEQFNINDTIWGCTSEGWICMDYVGVG